MHKGIDAVVFDFDGTIAKSEIHPESSLIDYILDRHPYKADDIFKRKRIKHASSNYGFLDFNVNKEHRESVLELLIKRNYEQISGDLVYHHKTKSILEELSNKYDLYIYSGRDYTSLKLAVEKMGIRYLFKEILAAEATKPGKPNPQQLQELANRNGFSVKSSVYIGDSIFDIELAKNSGCGYIQACWIDDCSIFDKQYLKCTNPEDLHSMIN